MKYLMHLANRDGLSEDAEGVERADMADAVSYAIQPAQCIICDDLLGGAIDLDQAIIIVPPGGKSYVLYFTSVVSRISASGYDRPPFGALDQHIHRSSAWHVRQPVTGAVSPPEEDYIERLARFRAIAEGSNNPAAANACIDLAHSSAFGI